MPYDTFTSESLKIQHQNELTGCKNNNNNVDLGKFLIHEFWTLVGLNVHEDNTDMNVLMKNVGVYLKQFVIEL